MKNKMWNKPMVKKELNYIICKINLTLKVNVDNFVNATTKNL